MSHAVAHPPVTGASPNLGLLLLKARTFIALILVFAFFAVAAGYCTC